MGTRGERDVQLFIVQPLAKVFGHSFQVPQTDLAGMVIIEQLEGTADLLHRIACQDEFRHCQSSRIDMSEGE